MDKSELIDVNSVVLDWLTMGIEDFFLSFRVGELDKFSRHEPFLNAMGLEMFCKGYLLAVKRTEYENLAVEEAKIKVNDLAKEMRHEVGIMVKEIKEHIGQGKVQLLLDKKYDVIDKKFDLTGLKVLKAIEASYFECRYPVPNPFYRKFPVSKLKGSYKAYWDPVNSSGLHEFCYELGRVILTDLKVKFDIEIPRSWWNQHIVGDEGRRFENLFFNSRREEFITKN